MHSVRLFFVDPPILLILVITSWSVCCLLSRFLNLPEHVFEYTPNLRKEKYGFWLEPENLDEKRGKLGLANKKLANILRIRNSFRGGPHGFFLTFLASARGRFGAVVASPKQIKPAVVRNCGVGWKAWVPPPPPTPTLSLPNCKNAVDFSDAEYTPHSQNQLTTLDFHSLGVGCVEAVGRCPATR